MRVRRIAVLRALQLGDLLCAVPAFRVLRRAHPTHRLTLVGLPWAEEFARRFPTIIDDFLPFPGWPGVPEREPDGPRFAAFERRATARRFALAVQMHGDGRVTNDFIRRVPAEAHAGFVPPSTAAPDDGFLRYPQGLSEVERLLSLSAHLVAHDSARELDATLEFPVTSQERRAAAELLQAEGVPAGGAYICMHAGGRGADRRWPPDRFAAVADALADSGYHLVLTGSEVDRAANEQVRARMRTPGVDLTGRTGLGELAAVIERATLVVTNDSAPSHLAAALRVPSVVLFTGSDPARWAPANRALHVAVGAGRPDGEDLPAALPSVDDVLRAVPAALHRREVHA